VGQDKPALIYQGILSVRQMSAAEPKSRIAEQQIGWRRPSTSDGAAEAYARMMRGEARFRIVLTTGQYLEDAT
jgi:hypothetical protein